MCPVLLTTVSPESSRIDILDQLCWRPWKKEKESLRDYMAEKGGGPFSWVVQAGWKRVGYLIVAGVGKPVRA
jgi:hypothetical protein